MYRRLAVVLSLALMAAMFLGSSTANAQDAVVCVFNGLAYNLTPGIQDTAEDLNDPNPLDIERGSYRLDADAACAGRIAGVVFAPSIVGDNASILSLPGHYDNTLCGTGVLHDQSAGTTLTVTGGTAPFGFPPQMSFGYEIPFIAGSGPMLIGTGTNLSGFADGPPLSTLFPHDVKYPSHGPHGPVTGSYRGLGAARITAGNATGARWAPRDTDNCHVDNNDGDNLNAHPAIDGTTDKFLVHGSFAVAR